MVAYSHNSPILRALTVYGYQWINRLVNKAILLWVRINLLN